MNDGQHDITIFERAFCILYDSIYDQKNCLRKARSKDSVYKIRQRILPTTGDYNSPYRYTFIQREPLSSAIKENIQSEKYDLFFYGKIKYKNNTTGKKKSFEFIFQQSPKFGAVQPIQKVFETTQPLN